MYFYEAQMNVSLSHTIAGVCHSRIRFGAFGTEDLGIRCHNAITAFFLRCFKKITDLTLADGTRIYLNKASYEKWKLAHENKPKLPYEITPKLDSPLKVVTYYCNRRFGKAYVTEAVRILNFNSNSMAEMKRGIGLLEEAEKLNIAYQFHKMSYKLVVDTLEESSNAMSELETNVELLSSRVENERKAVESGRTHPSALTKLAETASKLLEIFKKHKQKPIPYEEIHKTMEGLDQKEKQALSLKIDDSAVWKNTVEFAKKADFDILKGIDKVKELNKIKALSLAILSLSGKLRVSRLDADKAEEDAKINKFTDAIKDGIRNNNLSAAEKAMSEAQDFASNKWEIREQLKPYREFLDWMLTVIAFTRELEASELQKRVFEVLTKWNNALSEYSTIAPKEDVEAFKPLLLDFKSMSVVKILI